MIRLLRRGRIPHPFQWHIAEVAGELNDTLDGFRYPIVLVSVPRRGGKTLTCLAAGLDRMDVISDAHCWYTAGTSRETAAKLFRDEWVPMLNPLARLYRLRKSQGSEGIHKRRGASSLQLFAPNGDALHSTNADTVVIDEAWALDIDQGDAIEQGARGAQLTRPWRQTWIVSAGGTIESTWWDRWLTAGVAATPGVALFDYGADDTAPGYDPGDPRAWASHPAFGRTITEATLAHEWATRESNAGFERSILNVWPRPSSVVAASGLDLEQWVAARHPDVAPAPVTAIALDVSGDRSAASLAIAGRAPDGAVVVEVIEARPGVQWVAAAVRRARGAYKGARVVADSLVTASIVAELARAHVDVDPIGARAHAEACGTFVDLLAAGQLSHRGQAALDDAVAGAARRPLGDAWLWSRKHSTVDISPLVAVTLAAGTAHARRTPGRAVVVAASAPSGRSGPTGTRGPLSASPRGTQRPIR